MNPGSDRPTCSLPRRVDYNTGVQQVQTGTAIFATFSGGEKCDSSEVFETYSQFMEPVGRQSRDENPRRN